MKDIESKETLADDPKRDFAALYKCYFEPLCRYAYRFFPNKDDAYEIVQDAMLKICEKRNSLPGIDSLEKYLFRMVYNSCLNRLEHIKVEKKYSDYAQIELLEMELESFEDTYYPPEVEAQLRSEIETLSPQAKKVLGLRYSDGLKYKEIAEALGISVRTVESHLQNSIKILQEKLKKRVPDMGKKSY